MRGLLMGLLLAVGWHHFAAAQPVPRLGWSQVRPGALEARLPGLAAASQVRQWTDAQWTTVFVVTVAGSAAPIAGHYEPAGDRVFFTPVFAFAEQVPYQAQLRGHALPGLLLADATVRLVLPCVKRPPTQVLSIYPTTNQLPENLLRFYLYFSAPMREGVALAHVHLLDDTGHDQRGVFFDGQYELWNGDHTRLTLLVDPGRVKTGLAANRRLGRAFAPGHRYRLVIDPTWPDVHGQPLSHPFTKDFQALSADEQPPELARWKITLPAAGTTAPLLLAFDEPLDHVAAYQCVRVVTAAGQPVAGQVTLTRHEMQFAFRPRYRWARGEYSLLVNTRLEDLVGNNLNGLFDHAAGTLKQPLEGATERRTFRIR